MNGKAVILPLCGREFKNNNRDDGFILFFGRIKPYKGLELLAEAIGKSNHKNYNIKFVIAGSGDASGYDLQKHNVELINRYIDNGELYGLIERCTFEIMLET
jgi:glycosyltransferase involved in cell wall biosynthesis